MSKKIKCQMQTSRLNHVQVRFIEDQDVNLILKPLESQGIRESPKHQKKVPPHSDEESIFPVQNKPSYLFEKGDVGGQQLFGFQTPKRHNTQANKVTFSPDVSKTPLQRCVQNHRRFSPNGPPNLNRNSIKKKNINTSSKAEIEEDKNGIPVANSQTPYSLRKRLKSKIASTHVEKISYSDESEDFSASESEYEESDSSSSGSDSQAESDKSWSSTKKTFLSKQDLPSSHRKNKFNFVPAAEEYFQSHASKTVLTSNRTLGRLRHQLPQEELFKLLSNVPYGHVNFFKRLQNDKEYIFEKWNFLLSEGFNILLFGVGSKRNLLSSFHEQITEPHVVVNGFFPSLSIQEIVSSIAEEILGNTTSLDTLELVDLIKDAFSHKKSSHLFVVVHNIDGVMLRNNKNQRVLATLSQAANVHLIASVDHVSSALMWDQHILSMFNFLWWDVTSFEPYAAETAFESSLLVQQSGCLALSSLQSVFRSLTSNAKSIFLLMAEYQKANKKSSPYNGMPFKKLYSLCRESLLVSSDLALRSQLTEFLDHKLLKSRRGIDGSELLVIPIDSAILDQFVREQGDT